MSEIIQDAMEIKTQAGTQFDSGLETVTEVGAEPLVVIEQVAETRIESQAVVEPVVVGKAVSKTVHAGYSDHNPVTNSVPEKINFKDLPNELIVAIIENCDYKIRRNLRQTCRKIKKLEVATTTIQLRKIYAKFFNIKGADPWKYNLAFLLDIKEIYVNAGYQTHFYFLLPQTIASLNRRNLQSLNLKLLYFGNFVYKRMKQLIFGHDETSAQCRLLHVLNIVFILRNNPNFSIKSLSTLSTKWVLEVEFNYWTVLQRTKVILAEKNQCSDCMISRLFETFVYEMLYIKRYVKVCLALEVEANAELVEYFKQCIETEDGKFKWREGWANGFKKEFMTPNCLNNFEYSATVKKT